MSTNATATARLATATAKPAPDAEKGHRVRLFLGYVMAIALVAGIFAYGFNYYTLNSTERPFSPKHVLLKPSGAIGVKLGMLGLGMFLCIFLYPLRKRWAWLGRQGSSRHWMDNHVLLGLAAPFVIALHAAFKFRGFAGIAFWIMLAVSLSGVVGRYLYGQIPRSLNAAELSLKEVQDIQAKLGEQLAEQKILPQSDLGALLSLPSAERVQKLPTVVALVYMMLLDLSRIFKIATLRRRHLGFGEQLFHAGRFAERQVIPIWSGRLRLRAKRRPSPSACCFFPAPKKSSISGTSCTDPSATHLRCWRSSTSCWS